MAIPTWTRLAPCSLPSSTLRAGYAGGLPAMLDDSCARRRCKSAGRGRETVAIDRTEKHQLAQILVSPPAQFLMSLATVT